MTQQSLAALQKAINEAYLADEQRLISELTAGLDVYDPIPISACARTLIAGVREAKHPHSAIEGFLQEYQLNSEEGIVLMGIAEALLRIPDSRTQDLFLQEKLTRADWQRHLQHSDSSLVNLATKALLVAGGIEGHPPLTEPHWPPVFEGLLSRLGAPLIRAALKQAMQYLALQFVFAESMPEALKRSEHDRLFRYSFDRLGEAALTTADAERYFQAYRSAIDALAGHADCADIFANPGISIKLSALYPRYEPLQHVRAVRALTDKLLVLAH